jgi:hypothetical protein
VKRESPVQKAAPRVALIHATALAMAPIQAAFDRHWPQARCMNLLDDSLSVDLAEAGQLMPAMVQRFVDLAVYAQGTACSAILFTCSAFGPAIETAGAATGLPTLKPNEAMFDEALRLCPAGGRVGLVATFEASIPSMSAELQAMAARQGRVLSLHTRFVPEAMRDLAEGRVQDHHQKIARAAQELADCAVVMLAQFSMAAAQPLTQAGLSCPVLSSPDCAVLSLQKRMQDA